jgi:hypothetical protein
VEFWNSGIVVVVFVLIQKGTSNVIIFYYDGQQIIDNFNFAGIQISEVPLHALLGEEHVFFLNFNSDENELINTYNYLLKKEITEIDLLDPSRDNEEYKKCLGFHERYGKPVPGKRLRLSTIYKK